MPKFKSRMKSASEDAVLDAAARRLAEVQARKEFGADGFCSQVQRIADTREYRCYIAHQPAKAGMLVGKTIWLTVP